MFVRMQVDGQFGKDGPGKRSPGSCLEVRKIDDQYWATVSFIGHDGIFMVLLDNLLIPNTSNTMTFWSTLEHED